MRRRRRIIKTSRPSRAQEADVKMCLLYSEENRTYGCVLTAWQQSDPLQGFRTNFKSEGLGPATSYVLREYFDKDVIMELELCTEHGQVTMETIVTDKKVFRDTEHYCKYIEERLHDYSRFYEFYKSVSRPVHECTGCKRQTYEPPKSMKHFVDFSHTMLCGEYKFWGNVYGYQCKKCKFECNSLEYMFKHLDRCVFK